jgi:hypothetical protein
MNQGAWQVRNREQGLFWVIEMHDRSQNPTDAMPVGYTPIPYSNQLQNLFHNPWRELVQFF